MTTAQRNLGYNATNLNLPDIGKFLNSVLDALRDHDGKAPRDQVTSEAEYLLRNRYNLLVSSPALDIEIKKRVERALELLSRTGLICRKGLHSLSLTSKALIVSKEELDSIARETPVKQKIERQLVLPLPNEIATQIIHELTSAQLTSIEVEEQVLRHYVRSSILLSVEQHALDELRRRTIGAKRILEAKNLIEQDVHGMYTLSDRGRSVSDTQIDRITCLSPESFLRRQLIKLRLTMESRAQVETRKSILKKVFELVAGVIHRLHRQAINPSLRNPVAVTPTSQQMLEQSTAQQR
jgi:hypothetical protein